MFAALEFSPDHENLAGFERYLQQSGFPHRFSEHEGKMVVFVYEQDHVPLARQLYERFLLDPQGYASRPGNRGARFRPAPVAVRNYPVSLFLLAACVAGFLVVVFGQYSLLSWLSFQGLAVTGNTLETNAPLHVYQQLQAGQWWRLLTPVFLHFDLMHVIFNATLLWFLGSQIERQEGGVRYLLVVILIGVISNGVQYLYSPQNLFGGMSGVNYGLLAYCWMVNHRYERPLFMLPGGFFWFSVIMMLLGFAGVFSLFGYAIANWAHLAGFVAGFMMVPVFHHKKLSVS